jgi:hypothetical protein
MTPSFDDRSPPLATLPHSSLEDFQFGLVWLGDMRVDIFLFVLGSSLYTGQRCQILIDCRIIKLEERRRDVGGGIGGGRSSRGFDDRSVSLNSALPEHVDEWV